ncbi:MAG: hypothetical protein H0X67_17800 [Acidobacteria bacterium]|nr:hypothetical protein [Acidobacteriota bacterium]
MSFAARQARLRVMTLAESYARRFGSDENTWPIRVPREPLSLEHLVREALPEDHSRFDVRSLRGRTLLNFAWDAGGEWELWTMTLPSGLKLFCDAGADETRILASGGRHASDDTDRLFLTLLAESGGERFGIEMSGGAPTAIRTAVEDREQLVDFFLHLFEVTGAEASVRAQLDHAGVALEPGPAGADFRETVASWLDMAAS